MQKFGINYCCNLIESSSFNFAMIFFLFLEVELDPNRTWCPEIGCETICHVCSHDISKAKPVDCPTVSVEISDYSFYLQHKCLVTLILLTSVMQTRKKKRFEEFISTNFVFMDLIFNSLLKL